MKGVRIVLDGFFNEGYVDEFVDEFEFVEDRDYFFEGVESEFESENRMLFVVEGTNK